MHYTERLEEHSTPLAQHFDEAGEDTSALNYYRMAAEHAARQYANVEAAAFYARAIEIAKRIGTAPGTLIRLFTAYGRILELSARHADVMENIQQMELLARQRGDRALELAGTMERAKQYAIPSPNYNPVAGIEIAKQALPLAHELGDREAEARLLWI